MGVTLASAVSNWSLYWLKVNREALSVHEVALASYIQSLVTAYDEDMSDNRHINPNVDNAGLIRELFSIRRRDSPSIMRGGMQFSNAMTSHSDYDLYVINGIEDVHVQN